MYDQIIENLSRQITKEELTKIKDSNVHLGIFAEPYLSYMLDGVKTIESRFTKNRILPYEKITEKDTVIVKKSSGPVLAYFTVKKVLFFDLKKTPIVKIKEKYEKELCVKEDFWISKKNSNYATLIMIENLTNLKPFQIDKKGMQTWIKFQKKDNLKTKELKKGRLPLTPK